ncbi:hypothetical protein J437_LFUL002188 [Ladona fulva]|uniref:Clusterin-associated protein 1 n=1 Tax=Ladona fulva TaxID=123851 RepID=A0A8K0NUJ2_LADFU|nr:hypothetical protein J437_LFUL002188 [Ladona fulva]
MELSMSEPDFTEMMRSLGYQRLISIENFRRPNFPLVAEILVWLIQRFDPEYYLQKDLNSESERVAFIRAAAEFMALKARVKLNTKRLYQADQFAVKELLKPTTVLYNAQKINMYQIKPTKEKDESHTSIVNFESKVNEVKRAKELASKITSHGAVLYELLALEPKLKELRIAGATRSPDVSDAESALRQALKKMEAEISRIQKLTNDALATSSSLEMKVERKRQDLDRGRKQEFQKLEEELRLLYAEYLYRHRSLAYLQQQEEESAAMETERLEQTQLATRKLIEQMQKDSRGWDPLSLEPGDNDEDDLSEDKIENKAKLIRNGSRKSMLMNGKGTSRSSLSSKHSGTRNFGDKIEDDDEELNVDGEDASESALDSDSSDLRLEGGDELSDVDSIGVDDLEVELTSRSKSQQVRKSRSSANDDEF